MTDPRADTIRDHIRALRGMAEAAERHQIVCSDVAMRSWADTLEPALDGLLADAAALRESNESLKAHRATIQGVVGRAEDAERRVAALEQERDELLDKYEPDTDEPLPTAPSWEMVDKANARLIAEQARVAALESELTEWRTSIATEKLQARVAALEAVADAADRYVRGERASGAGLAPAEMQRLYDNLAAAADARAASAPAEEQT